MSLVRSVRMVLLYIPTFIFEMRYFENNIHNNSAVAGNTAEKRTRFPLIK